jgi:hypothetical protein
MSYESLVLKARLSSGHFAGIFGRWPSDQRIQGCSMILG